ncbi:two-component system, OmpR family, sensor histidine kinase ChvG [Sphingomonas laterariae]|uniref:histidine kinase n=1 Tax=Edaphosphingomonas laterariae TaxID=861865 RepID=A0A239DDN0_9SPHN|nr:ATP-binding protein [Sphingomonas laterariae]SNS30021.1 two-component system, OmpR family, sensor histidine kinase ChvG [Sphingomonas laterariae]
MAWGIALRRNDERDLALVWSSRWSLTTRILAVNIFALAMLAGGFFYLDSYRSQLNDARLAQAATQASLIAEALDAAPADRRQELMDKLERTSELRLRVYDRSGDRVLDSWSTGAPTYVLRDPDQESWERKAARTLDRMIDIVVGADKPARFAEPERDILSAWPEALAAAESGKPETQLRRAPDRTPVISAAAPMHDSGMTLLATTNARDIVRIVRAERFRLGIVLAMVITVSVLLSLFLARTIVRPLRRLARAAHRVRLGRARAVQVPRLPDRRDEIGLLARALSDMSLALRQRIDATEAFAADVTHELKNPLASLRSAVETLERVKDPALQKQLLDVVHDDVHRLDRLITDIADASRLDAELSRARFETIDLGQMIEGLIEARERRGIPSGVRLAFARPHAGTAVVHGDGARLTRVIENLVDNAISFSPPGALVKIAATRDGDEVVVRVDDEGPGVAPDVREAIFKRFHSIRPEGEAFGQHSGLGLAIAKAIVDAHNGTIMVEDRDDAPRGARFIIRLPVAER